MATVDPTPTGALKIHLTDRELEQADLINTLAFGMSDFEPSRCTELLHQFRRLHLPESTITEWRKWFLPIQYAETHCQECGEALTLEYPDLLAASFTCPVCHLEQTIHYSSLEPKNTYRKLATLIDRLYPGPDESPHANDPTSDGSTTQQLMELIDHEDICLDDLAVDRLKCRLALRGATIEQLDQSRNRFESAAPPLPPLTNLGLIEEHTEEQPDASPEEPPVTAQDEPILPEPLPDPEISAMSDTELLEALALRRSDYSPTAIAAMESAIVKRNFLLSDIDSWRDGKPLSREIDQPTLQPTKINDISGLLLTGPLMTFGFISLVVWLIYAPFGFLPLDTVRNWLEKFSWSAHNDLSFPAFFAKISAVVLLFATVNFLNWLQNAYKNTELLGAPPRHYRSAMVWVGILASMVAYYLYYQIGRIVLRYSTSETDSVIAPDLATYQSSESGSGQLLLLAANPSLMFSWATFQGFYFFALASSSDPIEFKVWWTMLLIQTACIFGTAAFVRKIERAQRAKLDVQHIQVH